MAGLFQGLEVGKRALLSNQICLQTIGHNISNVNTPGYSRQRVRISAFYPEETSYGTIGTGVVVDNIQHVRDLFLGEQFRQSNKSLGEWSYKEKIFSQIESLFSEPSDNTLSQRLSEFWNSWDTLSQHAESTTNRQALLGTATSLISEFHELSTHLNKLRNSIDYDMVAMTGEVNRLGAEVAKLNQQIKVQELGNVTANDLRDSRDQLIDNLSSLVDVRTIEEDNGQVRVSIGSLEIVNGSDSVDIDAESYVSNQNLKHRLIWKNTSVEITSERGEMKGLLDTRDMIIPKYIDKLDRLAKTVVEQVNAIHVTGYGLDDSTGNNFFNPNFTTAATIRLNSDLEQSPDKIAASASGEVGDGDIALSIQLLKDERIMVNGSSTINEYYNGIIGSIGVESQEALSFADNYRLMNQQVKNSRQSVRGVSLDEEMTNIIKFQHAYDASARVITVMDEALDVVISRMGIVGR
ncbi:MAG: flagellar hook-associated protein FlgK [candidate division Zixibacteria bacterium]|nr:flagellar hook-associated protein FlgK [candidate division Zixibacteria bacterium]